MDQKQLEYIRSLDHREYKQIFCTPCSLTPSYMIGIKQRSAWAKKYIANHKVNK